MARSWTTRCCSAIALIVVTVQALSGQKKTEEPLRLMPVTPIWNLPLNSPLAAPPVMTATRGYFPIDGDRLVAYDIEHGTLLWIAKAHARFQPVLGNDLVFVVETDAVTAFHDDTGAQAWRVQLPGELGAALVWDNRWLIGTVEPGVVTALRAEDGAVLWRQDVGGRIRGAAAISGDGVYVPLDDGRIVALKTENGERLWEKRLGGMPNEILALPDRLFVGSNDNYFYAIRAKTGETLWRWSTGADVVGLPVVDRRRVYFVSMDNVLRGLDRNSGALRWRRSLPIRPTRGPLLVNDMLIVSGVSGKSPAYWVKDGTPAGDIAGVGELAAVPHVVPGTTRPQVVLVTRDVAENTVVRAFARAVDPAERDIAPLPNAVMPPAPPELESEPVDDSVVAEPEPEPEPEPDVPSQPIPDEPRRQ